MNTRTVTRSVFTSPARSYTAIEPLESRIAPAITLLGVPNWLNEGPGQTTGGQVEGMGDNQVVGAIEKIAAHPTNADIVYVATVHGGIWKTGNATAVNPTWTPLTETLPATGFASIAFDPTDASGNTLWAGYGGVSSGGDNGPLFGIIKTTNGGTSWTDVGGAITDGQTFRSLIPTGVNDAGSGQQIVMAASVSSATGLLRSTDNGVTFTDVSDGAPGNLPNAAVSHLVGDPGNSTRFYAAVPGSGIYVSTDTGATWTQVNTGLGGVGASTRIELSVSAAAGNPVYAGVIAGGLVTGLFRSPDQGANWTTLDLPQTVEGGTPVGLNPNPNKITPGGQAGLHFSILADATNPNVVFVGGDRQPNPLPNSIGANDFSGRLFRGDASLAAGTQFAPITNNGAGGTSPHADSRDMVFDANGNILEADDGGLYRLTNPNAAGRLWSEVIGDLRITEFYSTAYDSVNDLIIGGAQDTGVHAQPAGGGTTWTQVSAGDGNITAISVTPGANPIARRFTMSNNFSSFTLTSDPLVGASSTSGQALTGLNATDSGFTGFSLFPFVTNAVSTVAASGRLLIGGNGLYESTDFGSTVTDITIAGQNNYQSLAYGGRSGGVDNPDVAYVGVGNQLFLRTAAAGAFSLLTAFPGSTAADIVLNANDWRDAFVLDGNQVFRTIDAGTTWADITGDLGTLSTDLRTIEFYDGAGTPALVVGGFGGVFRLTLDGTPAVASDWSEYGTVLPNVLVKEVSFDAGDDILVAGTWGRGAWSVSSVSASINVAGILEINGDTDFAGQDDTIRLVRNQANPNLLEVFLNNNTGTPDEIIELSQLERIIINGLGGDDTLVLDSSNGLIDVQDGIHYDGGSGHDAMRLEQPGNATPQTSDIYSVGPAIGGGSSLITGPSGVQDVEFENLEPVLDLVPAASQIVNATPENNAIDYAAGAVPANGKITIDNYESFEFSNKVTLIINGLAGSDEISLNNPTTPTGLTSITIDGGNPTGSDTLIVTGTIASDTVTFTPTSFRSGSLTGLAAPITFDAIESVKFFGGDAGGLNTITIEGTVIGETLTVDAGLAFAGNLRGFLTPDFDFFEAGRITFNGNGGFDSVNVSGSDGTDSVTTAANAVSVSTPNNLVIVTLGTGVDLLNISTLAGDDSVNLSTLPAPTVAIISGGDGNDTLIGSPQADTLYGGAGNDVLVGGAGVDSQYGEDGNDIFGNPTLTSDGVADDAGNDFNFGGPGFDNFVWEPGDGADFNNGGEDGADIFRFFGSAAANVFTLRSGGTPTHFNALIGAVNIDNHGIEDVVVDGQGGADSFLVEDLFATEVVSLNLILGAADAALDSVTVNARAANDNLLVSTPAAGALRISGLRYNINVTAAEATDSLTINGNDGDDAINVSLGVAAIIGVAINGGAGSDVLSGDAANINGGDGNDTLIGSAINNTFDGGAGDDTFLGNGGTDAIGGGAGSSVGDTILLPGTAGNDTLALALNATGHLDATINGLLTTYTNFVGGAIATSGIERIKADGQDGNDLLTVDSTNGAVPIPVTFDGGASSDSLTLTGGTATSNTYAPGPIAGAGTSTIVIGGVTQTVNFTGLEPVLDLVGGPLTVSGTNAANVIEYGQGNVAANGRVSVDGFETIEFSNKTILILNGLAGSDTINIDNAATPTGLTGISIDGGAGDDSVALFGTPIADDFTFTGIDATTGALTLTGLVPVTYLGTEHAQLFGLGGDDVFRVGSAAGRVEIFGGDGSDTVDFSTAPSSVLFDLDAVGIAQHVNISGEVVTLLEVMENFIGTSFNDILNVDAAAFPRTVNGGPHLLPLPPGDKLILDGQGEAVQVVKSDFNTGVIKTKGHADVTFDEFETIKIINSSTGVFESGKAFSAGIVYDLTQQVAKPGRPILGKAPTGVATGDLNGDTFADIVTANNRSGNITVLINKGDGTFNTPINIKTGANPQDVALIDLDGDLDLDVVVTNSGASNIAVLLGNGAGGFAAPAITKTKPKPGAIALGDLNGDLVPDLVVTHVGRNTVSVLIGNGAGGFGTPVETKSGGTGPVDVVIGDFNVDGNNDVAVVNTSSRTLSVLTGNGGGGFAGATQIFQVGVRPTGVAITDINTDGRPDLVVSHYISRFAAVLFGNGNVAGPQFQPMMRANFPGTHAPNAVAVADFNGDGFIDLGFANGLSGRFTAILGNGLGDFSSPYEFDMGDTSARIVTALSIVDVNNDGGLDIVTANTGTSDVSVLLRHLV